MHEAFTVSGNLIDIHSREIYPATVFVESGRIKRIERDPGKEYANYVLPGFIDAHVHVESSMLVPSEFARLSVVHGTVATVSDPHEIANVLGIEGIRYMITNGKKVPFKFYFGASSCVPATSFETAGAEVTADDIRELFEKDGLHYLSEMMNYPGVLNNDPVVMDKITVAKVMGLPIDGHSPGLMGEQAEIYVKAGISTDHECYMLEEALGKLDLGMNIIIREGSAAKNFDALHTIISEHSGHVMFCSDDKHPNDLIVSQIDGIVRKALSKGYDLFNVLKCACINPVPHYKLDVGMMREGDPADFIVIDSLESFRVEATYIDGVKVAEKGRSLIQSVNAEEVNNFNTQRKSAEDFRLKCDCSEIRVIEAIDGEIITNEITCKPKSEGGYLVSDTDNDILKLTVVCRYTNDAPVVAFIKNFGLKNGAIASCVAHDSHNIIAVGVTDDDIAHAVNGIIDEKGGISVSADGITEVLPLPVAGIMTTDDGYKTAERYSKLDSLAKELGSTLYAPFMTLSFMALPVIPALKLSDKGLFDVSRFGFTDICKSIEG
ncbi:MAG: adenine deaminase [Ignavibacteriae bacterium]|nr:adenine deaminase [Ignavibacteriota bacterium]MCB9244748.1 adenine deaminase [Ignavibacteriales bacterium]